MEVAPVGDVGALLSVSASVSMSSSRLWKVECVLWDTLQLFGGRAVNGVGGRGVSGDRGVIRGKSARLLAIGVAKFTV